MKYIFDFDDVLFNNTEQFKKHMFRALARYGIPEVEARARYLEVRGREFSLKNFITTLFSSYGASDLIDQTYETIMQECVGCLNTKLIREVQKLRKEDCYLVTNGEREFQQEKIRRSGIDVEKLFKEIHIVPGTKKEVVKDICDKNKDEEVVFIDDRQHFFDDIVDCQNLRPILYSGQEFVELKRNIEMKNDKRNPTSELRKTA